MNKMSYQKKYRSIYIYCQKRIIYNLLKFSKFYEIEFSNNNR